MPQILIQGSTMQFFVSIGKKVAEVISSLRVEHFTCRNLLVAVLFAASELIVEHTRPLVKDTEPYCEDSEGNGQSGRVYFSVCKQIQN